ncbi:calponin homology domain-containing protein DDB_G0272472-like [Cloeon dipterum]|uniref:calponin homology domain-containing protein DDB_G0272472-like n=1 Tax=Cloeon dipterum TaxID=197152 RepID=UPI00321F8F95
MSWWNESRLESPENLRQFIKDLINTELISEQQKIKIHTEGNGNTTIAINDPVLEMDFRHKEAKEINAVNLAQMKVPKQQLIKEARRIVLQEEIDEKMKRHQAASFSRELRQLKEDLENSSKALAFTPTTDSNRRRSLSATKNSSDTKLRLEKRAQSCTSEIFKWSGSNDQEKIPVETPEINSNYSSDWHSDCESGSEEYTSGSDSSASTIMKRINVRKNNDLKKQQVWLPPLKNISVTSKTVNQVVHAQKSPKLERIDQTEDKMHLRKYWLIWRAVAFRQRNLLKLKKRDEDRSSQIEAFVSQFESDQSNSESPILSLASTDNSRSKSKYSSRKSNCKSYTSKKTKSCSNLEQIIRDQKAKLREQEEMISKLKLEQIRLAAEKSKRSTQELMENSLKDSSVPLKRKLNYLRSSFPDILDSRNFEKPRPSFLVQMEKRHQARIERKKELREQTRLRILEQKRVQQEKEAARKAEIAEQKRLEQEAKLEQMQFEAERRANEEAAREFCRRRRLRMAFQMLRRLLDQRERRLEKADELRQIKLLAHAFCRWREATKERVKIKFVEAKRHHQMQLTRFAWNKWREVSLEARRDRQVAEDFSDLSVQDRAFKMWRLTTKEAYNEVCEKIFDAELHYERNIMRKCWCAWKKYHLVVAEEKETESKKEALRNAIRDVLPDFMPNFMEPKRLPNQL